MAGEWRQPLQDALLEAFPNEDSLRELVSRMGLNLPVITTGRSLAVMVLDVIVYMDARGLIERFVAGACELRPFNTGFGNVVKEYWPQVRRPQASSPDLNALPAARNAHTLSEYDWTQLIESIRDKRLTPVIGPGACGGAVPEPPALATQWADGHQYPFPDRGELARVSQFLALSEYRLMPHEQLQRLYGPTGAPNLARALKVHGPLAELGLPLYLTTNYDSFMTKALEQRGFQPSRAFPCWNSMLRDAAAMDTPAPEPVRPPLVYHLFGHNGTPESMVLTEDDHFEFLASVISDPKLLPPNVKQALSRTSLLFIGYRVLDFGFRVLIRALLKSVTAPNKRFHVAVQLPDENLNEAQRAQVEKYLKGFLNDSGNLRFTVFWGNAEEFTQSLRDRCERERANASNGN